MAGEILSATAVNATVFDPQSSIGIDGSGWVLNVVLAGITSLVGTIDAKALTVTLQDPGYDGNGNATTVTRVITGNEPLRRQHPNGTQRIISTDGTNLTIAIVMTGWLYSATTIVSAVITSGFYTGAANSSAPTRTNNSVLAYIKPLWGWDNIQLERATGNTYRVEGIPMHRHPQQGRMVACVKYNVTDGTNTSADVLVNAPTLSTLLIKGNIPEVYAADVDMSTQLTSSAIMYSRVNAIVYPWIGDASAVLNLAVDGAAWPTSLPITPLRVFCDRVGAYGDAFAYVDGTGAGTPQVAATAATARANPYASVAAAATALRSWNNTNKLHNDYGGATIRIMDNAGAPRALVMSAGTANAPGLTYMVIEKDPLATAEVTITWGNQHSHSPMILWRGLKIATNAASGYGFLGHSAGAARDVFAIDNCTYDNTANKSTLEWYQLTYWRNVTFLGANSFVTSAKNTALMAGCISGDGIGTPNADTTAKLTIGNILPLLTIKLDQQSGDGDHGRIIYNNTLTRIFLNSQTSYTINSGIAIVQNLCEAVLAGNAAAIHLFADGDRTTCLNIIQGYNTGVGERCSQTYNDNVGTRVAPSGVKKNICSFFNIWDNYNIKADAFSGGGVGSVGAWPATYGVGNEYNVSLFGIVNRDTTSLPSNDGSDNYSGSAWHPTSEPNLYRAAYGLTQANIMDLFIDYRAAPRAVPATGGNYRPKSSSTQFAKIPVNRGALLRDISGALRRTTAGAALGAYEFSDPLVSTVSSNSANEGTAIVHTVTLSAVTAATINYAATLVGSGTYPAVNGVNFSTNLATATCSNGVTFSAGNLVVPSGVTSFTVTVPTTNDAKYNNPLTYLLTVGGIVGTGTINNINAAPLVTVTDAVITVRGTVLTFTATQPVISGVDSVFLATTVSDTAVAGADFTPRSTFAITIPAGSLSASGTVQGLA